MLGVYKKEYAPIYAYESINWNQKVLVGECHDNKTIIYKIHHSLCVSNADGWDPNSMMFHSTLKRKLPYRKMDRIHTCIHPDIPNIEIPVAAV